MYFPAKNPQPSPPHHYRPVRVRTGKAVNRGDKRARLVRDRVFVKFERSRRYRDRYRDRYRCQEKNSRRGRARDPVFRDPPTPRTSPRSLFAARDSPPPPALHISSHLLATHRTLKKEKFKVEKNRCINYTKVQKYV